MKTPRSALAAFCFFFGILSLLSCDILRDTPFAVVSWSPGREYVPMGENGTLAIALTFSADAEHGSVEKEFTITEDGTEFRGSFVWADSRTVRFAPYAPLRENREYRLTLGSEAASSSGVSMDDAFEKRFFTREAGERPRVLSVSPSDGAIVADRQTPISLVFSTQVEASSCRDYVSISPAITGSWSVDQSGTTASFVGAEVWETGKEYLIEVSADMIDQKRIRLGDAYRFRFQVGSDRTAPVLLGAYALDSGGTQTATLT
ncbi:MAG: Ig-like domain-containing protein, partial [Treponemataceae bacterium]